MAADEIERYRQSLAETKTELRFRDCARTLADVPPDPESALVKPFPRCRLTERVSQGEFRELAPDVRFENITTLNSALVDYASVHVTPEFLVEEYRWQNVAFMPPLQFDHHEITEKALVVLRSHVYQHPIARALLPEKFTLPEIHALYEAILGKQFDRRNFRKRLLSLGLVIQLAEQRKIGPHRSPFLYEFAAEPVENEGTTRPFVS